MRPLEHGQPQKRTEESYLVQESLGLDNISIG
jgi:hypothetical protein